MVTIVGMGPGGPEYVTPAARRAIDAADLVLGSDRWAKILGLGSDKWLNFSPIGRLLPIIRSESQKKNIAVLVSGDPGLYSLLGLIKRELPGLEFAVIPGISASQVLFAKLGLEWEDVRPVSLHGRPLDRLNAYLQPGARLCLFIDQQNNCQAVGRVLVERGLSGKAVVGENLTEPNEKLTAMGFDDLIAYEACSLAVVYLEIDK